MKANESSPQRMTLRQYCQSNPRFAWLLDQWHPEKNGDLTPDDVYKSGGTLVWWRCEKGHEWQTQVGSRKNGTGCPYCAAARRQQRKNKGESA